MTALRPSRYEFGPFRVDVARRLLVREDEAVALTPRTFDTLLALLERPGEVVDKETLMTAVWADTTVEEGNLTQQISLLRKALGEQPAENAYVATVPRRGYRFVAPVRVTTASGEPIGSTRAQYVVGRDAERRALSAAFSRAVAGRGHMICLAGEPGIGKSTIAESFLADLGGGETRAWVARGRCSERLAGTDAYLPLLEALDHVAALPRPIDGAARLRPWRVAVSDVHRRQSSPGDRMLDGTPQCRRDLATQSPPDRRHRYPRRHQRDGDYGHARSAGRADRHARRRRVRNRRRRRRNAARLGEG